MEARGRFAKELLIAVPPWVLVIGALVFGMPESRFGAGLAVAFAGLLFFVKQQFRYPGQGAVPGTTGTKASERATPAIIHGVRAFARARAARRARRSSPSTTRHGTP